MSMLEITELTFEGGIEHLIDGRFDAVSGVAVGHSTNAAANITTFTASFEAVAEELKALPC